MLVCVGACECVCIFMVNCSLAGTKVQLIRTVVFVIGCMLYVAEAIYYDYWGERIDMSQFNTSAEKE